MNAGHPVFRHRYAIQTTEQDRPGAHGAWVKRGYDHEVLRRCGQTLAASLEIPVDQLAFGVSSGILNAILLYDGIDSLGNQTPGTVRKDASNAKGATRSRLLRKGYRTRRSVLGPQKNSFRGADAWKDIIHRSFPLASQEAAARAA